MDFEETWGSISLAFREIHTKNASRLSYEELYRHAYRIVLKKKGDELYERVCQFEHEWLSTEVRNEIQALFAPNLLAEQGMGGTTANERRIAGEKFLRGLKQAWGDHQVSVSMLADVLMYMVRCSLHALIEATRKLTCLRKGSCLLPRPPTHIHIYSCHDPLPRRYSKFKHLG